MQAPGLRQRPPLHLPPAPHSASFWQNTQTLSLHTIPFSQSSLVWHAPPFFWHFPWRQILPAGQSELVAHWAHCLLMHFSPGLQSLSPSHLGYLAPEHPTRPINNEINNRRGALAMAATLVTTARRCNLRCTASGVGCESDGAAPPATDRRRAQHLDHAAPRPRDRGVHRRSGRIGQGGPGQA